MDATCEHSRENLLTSIINLWAGPGVGKSRTAAGLFNLMKTRGHKVELVTEVAKFYTYERNLSALKDSFLLMSRQEYVQKIIADNGVDWIITDSPPMLGLAYAPKVDLPALHKMAEHFRGRYTNYDVCLVRDTSRPYEQYGRNQTLPEAQALDVRIHELFEAACEHPTCVSWAEHLSRPDIPNEIYWRMVEAV